MRHLALPTATSSQNIRNIVIYRSSNQWELQKWLLQTLLCSIRIPDPVKGIGKEGTLGLMDCRKGSGVLAGLWDGLSAKTMGSRAAPTRLQPVDKGKRLSLPASVLLRAHLNPEPSFGAPNTRRIWINQSVEDHWEERRIFQVRTEWRTSFYSLD